MRCSAHTTRAFDISTWDLATHSQSGGQFFGSHASNNGKIMIFAGGIPLNFQPTGNCISKPSQRYTSSREQRNAASLSALSRTRKAPRFNQNGTSPCFEGGVTP